MADQIIHIILPTIEHFGMLGYWIAFLAALLETTIGIGLVLPGSTLILFLGALSARGYLDVGDLLWFAIIGAIIGDNLNYYLGKKYGARWIKNGVWFLKPEHFEKSRAFFDAHGAKSIFLGRFIPSVKEIVPFFAGSVRMRQRTFFIWNVLGAIGWGFQWVGTGYIFAQSLTLAQTWLSRSGYLFAILLAVFIIFYLIKRLAVKKGRYFFSLVASLGRSLKEAISANPDIQKTIRRHPFLFQFLGNRFRIQSFFGLPATILGLAFVYVLALYGGIIEDLLTSDPIVAADVRIAHLLAVFRMPGPTTVFLWITLLGKWQVIVVSILSATTLLWLWKKRRYILPLLIAVAGSQLFTQFGKLIFHRPRPQTALYVEHSFSFPSGHATIAVAFYGFLTYFLIRETKKWGTKVNLFCAGMGIILLIGFSRLYLGVHYLSDVWGGYLVGLLWLIVAIGVSEWLGFSKKAPAALAASLQTRFVSVALVAASLVFYVGFAVFYNPPHMPHLPPKKVVVQQALDIFSNPQLKYTESVIGERQEPISFILIAKNDTRFIGAFQRAGWLLADDISVSSMARLFRAAIFNSAYSTAPITPSFWQTQVNDFAFRKKADRHNSHQQNNARFWKTHDILKNGDRIYVGTTLRETDFVWRMTHKIFSDIDTERESLFNDLKKSGTISKFQKIKLVKPAVIESFMRGQFFTDGLAYVLTIP